MTTNFMYEFSDEDFAEYYYNTAVIRLPVTSAMVIDIKSELQYCKKAEVKSILDVGCGAGDLLVALRQQFEGADIKGLDVSELMLQYSQTMLDRQKVQNIKLMKGYIEDLNEKENTYDVITSQYSFQYWDFNRALSNIVRMLKPGGIAFIRTVNPEISKEYYSRFWNSLEQYKNYEYFEQCKSSLWDAIENGVSIDKTKEILDKCHIEKYDIYFMNRNSSYSKNYDKLKDKVINFNIILYK